MLKAILLGLCGGAVITGVTLAMDCLWYRYLYTGSPFSQALRTITTILFVMALSSVCALFAIRMGWYP